MSGLSRRVGADGSGSVLGIALVAAMLCVLFAALPLYRGMSVRQANIDAADAAALAGADVAVGIIPGIPCEVAATVAAANGAKLASCALDGVVVTVSTKRSFLGLPLIAVATAGPPGSPPD